MKKMYLFLFVMSAAFSFKTQAANWTVNVKDDFYENPAGFAPVVGDSITWVWMGAHNHTVTSVTVPSGAAALSSPQQMTGTYGYKIMVAGAYAYDCEVHGPSMAGSFTATNPGTGVPEPKLTVVSSAYPNPFENKFTINTRNADRIVIYNATGQQLRDIEIRAIESSSDFDFTNSPKGVYYYSTLKQGIVMERKAIIKTN